LSVTVAEDSPAGITLTAVNSNANPLTYNIVSPATNGSLAGTGANRTYTPAPDFQGTDSFTYSVSDGVRTSNVSTVTINVTEVNDAPVAAGDDKSTDEDAPLSFAASDLTANDNAGAADEVGQTLTATNVSSSGDTHGTVELVGGQVTYTPAANYNGPASFTYEVCDNGTTSSVLDSKCATATVSVTVNSVNDQPVANDDSAATDEDTAVIVDVRANDTDADGDTLGVSNVGAATKGTTEITPDGKVRYTPNADANGTDSFTYTVSDGQNATGTATVNVTINSVNDAPVLSNVPASWTINELAAYSFTATATDVDEQQLTFSLVGAPAGATIDSAGQFSWTPTEEQGGTGAPYSFKVRVSDGIVTTDADITLTVNEVNQNPTLAAISNQTIYLGSALTFTAAGEDADLPAQSLTYSLTGTVPTGASITPAGVFSWMPSASQAGAVYSITARVTDNGSPNLYAEQTFTVGVAYTWTGVLSPINADGTSVFKLGRTIPVKFKLAGASTGITTAVAKVYIAKVNNNVVGEAVEADATGGSTDSNIFRYDPTTDQYIFNLDTKGLTPGTYQLQVDMGDGVVRTVTFGLN
jgi:large repetitive protein